MYCILLCSWKADMVLATSFLCCSPPSSPLHAHIPLSQCHWNEKVCVDLNLHLICVQRCRVIVSLCVTLRWKRDKGKQTWSQVVAVKSAVSKANPEWAVFAGDDKTLWETLRVFGECLCLCGCVFLLHSVDRLKGSSVPDETGGTPIVTGLQSFLSLPPPVHSAFA